MKERSSAIETKDELENDLTRVMLIEKRHAGRIGSRQARDLIEKVKDVLHQTDDHIPQDLIGDFPVH